MLAMVLMDIRLTSPVAWKTRIMPRHRDTMIASMLRQHRERVEADLKIRSRKFEGRCAKHKRYNPAVDGRGGIHGGCVRCSLLCDIWESSLKLNQLIRKFDPNHDDLQRLAISKIPPPDPRQMSLIPD